jgi:hypothetical protein
MHVEFTIKNDACVACTRKILKIASVSRLRRAILEGGARTPRGSHGKRTSHKGKCMYTQGKFVFRQGKVVYLRRVRLCSDTWH